MATVSAPHELQSTPCIWCKAERYRPSLEHILPEALGCPPGFVLANGVCTPCNNRFGVLDQALLRAFELQAFLLGIPRKRGRPPSVDSWGWMTGRHGKQGPELHINAGPDAYNALGRDLAGGSARNGLLNPSVEVQGPIATTHFEMPFGDDPRFVRALYKVALGAVAFFNGIDVASRVLYDPIREFVQTGQGRFSVMLGGEIGPPINHFVPPWAHPDRPGLMVGMRILGADLIADLNADQSGLAVFRAEIAREPSHGTWVTIPPSPAIRRSGYEPGE